MNGIIRSFDGADGLGWIDLDDGRAVRFGLSACNAMVPREGQRVSVGGVEERRGVLRATALEPVFETVDLERRVWPEVRQELGIEHLWIDGEQRETRVRYVLFDRDAAYVRAPQWPGPEAFAGRAYAPKLDGAVGHEPHPFFAPWHEGIEAAGVGALSLSATADGVAGKFGGAEAHLVGAWPQCATHGPMALIVAIEPGAIAAVVGIARRLTLHACIACLNASRRAWLGEPGCTAAVEWAAEPGTLRTVPQATIEEVGLHATPAISVPPSWMFRPRRDVEGHEPVGGIPSELFDVHLLREHSSRPEDAYQEAFFQYDRHYNGRNIDVMVGGFATFRFALCRTCGEPMRQLLYVVDYFSEPGLRELLEGSMEMVLLACDRTPACGGPERGLLVIDP